MLFRTYCSLEFRVIHSFIETMKNQQKKFQENSFYNWSYEHDK